MSLVDTFRSAIAPRLFGKAFPLTATTTTQGAHDFVTDTYAAGETITREGLGALGKRRVVSDDGIVRIQSVCRLNISVASGDKITIGQQVRDVTDFEALDPDGMGAIVYIAVLK